MYSVLRCCKSDYTKGNLIQENKSSKRGSLRTHIPYILNTIYLYQKQKLAQENMGVRNNVT